MSGQHRRGKMLRQKLLAPLALTVVTLAGACGSGTSTPAQRPARPAEFKDARDLFITRQDIARQKTAPAAAVMRWWQALQFQDAVTATNSYAPKMQRKRVADLARKLSPFLTSSQPQIEEAQVRGTSARVLATIQWVAFTRSATQVVELPVTFYLVRRGSNGWKLADNSFLAYRLKLQRQQEKSAG